MPKLKNSEDLENSENVGGIPTKIPVLNSIFYLKLKVLPSKLKNFFLDLRIREINLLARRKKISE